MGLAQASFSVSSAPSATAYTGNLFLDHLSPNTREALLASLVPVSLKLGTVMYDRNDPIDKVLFPIGGILSVVLEMSDGDTAEVGIIGKEGMSGLVVALGMATSNQRTVVQVPDGALCTPVEAFRAALKSEPELKETALRYAQATLMATAHSPRATACIPPTNAARAGC